MSAFLIIAIFSASTTWVCSPSGAGMESTCYPVEQFSGEK